MTEEERLRILRLRQAQSRQAPQSQGGVSTDSQAVDEFQGKFRSMFEGAKEGVTYGLVDEAAAALGATLGVTPGPEFGQGTWKDRYQVNRDKIRGEQDAARTANPTAYAGGELIGAGSQGVRSGIGIDKAMRGVSPFFNNLAGRTITSAVTGAGEGALYGAGTADGEDMAARAAAGAGSGAFAGAVAPLAVAGAGAVKDIAGGGLDGMLNRASKGRAARAVSDTIERSGQSADDVARRVAQASAEGQPMYRAIDALGDAGQRRISGLVRGGGDTASEIADYLQERAAGALDRTADFTDDAFGLNGQTREAIENTVRKNRKTVADTMFEQAADDALPVDVRPTIAALDDTIGKMQNSGIESPEVVKEFEKLRRKLAGVTPEGDPTTLSDYNSVLAIWREVRDDIDGFYKNSKGNIGEALKPIRDSLQASLEESSDLYRFATDNYREGSKVIDAFQTGADAAKKRGRLENTIATFDGLTEQQKQAARVGYGDETITRFQNKNAEAPNVLREMISPKRKAEVAAMALNPEEYARQISREGDMFKTFNAALGGSKTADNLENIADVSAVADLARAGSAAASSNPTGVVGSLFNAAAPYLRGENEATRKLIAEALMSDNPRISIEKAAKSGMLSDNIRRAFEAFLRAGGRVATSQ